MAQSGVVNLAVFGAGRAGRIHVSNVLANHRTALLYVVEENTQIAEKLLAELNCTSAEVLRTESSEKIFQDPRRFDPAVSSLRTRLRTGEIGHLYSVRTCSRDHPLPPVEFLRHSGGMFHDCAIHDIDMVCWTLGEYPTTVFVMAAAHNDAIRELGDVDTVTISLRFPSGVLGDINLSRHSSYGYDQRIELFGSKGMLLSQNQYPDGVESHTAAGTCLGRIKHSFPQRYRESYQLALDHFADVCQGVTSPLVTAAETLKASVVADACHQSHVTGLPVTVDYSACDALTQAETNGIDDVSM